MLFFLTNTNPLGVSPTADVRPHLPLHHHHRLINTLKVSLVKGLILDDWWSLNMSSWNNFHGLCSLPRLTDPADRKHPNRRPGPFSPVQLLSPQLLATQLHDQTDKELVGYKRAACVQWCWIHLLRSNTAQLYLLLQVFAQTRGLHVQGALLPALIMPGKVGIQLCSEHDEFHFWDSERVCALCISGRTRYM